MSKASTQPLHSEQLDAPLIDSELLSLILFHSKKLVRQVSLLTEFPNFVRTVFPFVFRSILFFLTIGNDFPTPGMAIFGLRLRMKNERISDGIYRRSKWILYLFSIMFFSIEDYLRKIVVSIDRRVTSSSILDRNSRERRHFIINNMLLVIDFARILNYIQFLMNPLTAPPMLSMRLAGVNYCKMMEDEAKAQNRVINYSYAYRRVLYAELFRCFLCIFPLEGFRICLASLNTLSRSYRRFLSKIGVIKNSSQQIDTESEDKCPICNSHPITIPYILYPCRHKYCYICLRNAVENDISFHCITCGMKLVSSMPWSATST